MGFAANNEIDNINRETRESELQMSADSWTHNIIMEAWSPNSASGLDYSKSDTDNMNRSTQQLQAELNNALMLNPYQNSRKK